MPRQPRGKRSTTTDGDVQVVAKNDIGAHRVFDVGPETLTQWQSKLLDRYAPYTVLNCRNVCRQAFTEAVKFGLISANPFDLVKAPRAKRVKAGRALSPPTPRR